jgi:predicted RNase H-like HicB family nuclease
MRKMKYLIVYERSATGWGAYAPDLRRLGVAGRTLEETKELIREAVEFHLEGMRQHGDPIPVPSTETEYITVG